MLEIPKKGFNTLSTRKVHVRVYTRVSESTFRQRGALTILITKWYFILQSVKNLAVKSLSIIGPKFGNISSWYFCHLMEFVMVDGFSSLLLISRLSQQKKVKKGQKLRNFGKAFDSYFFDQSQNEEPFRDQDGVSVGWVLNFWFDLHSPRSKGLGLLIPKWYFLLKLIKIQLVQEPRNMAKKMSYLTISL